MAVSPRKRRKRSPRKAKAASAPKWLRTALDTWPKKAAAAVGAALFASAMSYFIGADFWRGVEKKVVGGPPVEIHTITDIDSFSTDVVHVPEFVVARPIGKVTRPPSGNAFEGRFQWAREMGGVDVLASVIRVVVSGKPDRPTLLQGMRVKLVERRPPLDGTLLTYTGIGAAQSVRYIEIDLGKDPPSLNYIGDEGKPEEHFPLRVTESETEVFDVLAVAPRGDQLWYLELAWTSQGEQGTIRIDDNGKPFRTTQASRASSYFWWKGRWQKPQN